MKIENRYIRINNGKKVTKIKNHIVDNYLIYFAQRQYLSLSNAAAIADLTIDKLFIKFDTIVDDAEEPTSYDLILDGSVVYTNSTSYVNATYYYRTSNLSNIDKDIDAWTGHNIYYLGFGHEKEDGSYVIYAYVDISEYAIYLDESGFLDIIRDDMISSDAICSNIPYHLAPLLDNKIGQIYSIGLGFSEGDISEEFLIGDNISLVITGNLEVEPYGGLSNYVFFPQFNDLYPSEEFCPSDDEMVAINNGYRLTFGGTSDYTQYPQNDVYPQDDIFPTQYYVNDRETVPLTTLAPRTGLVPLRTNYKYIIYKYRVCEYNGENEPLTQTDEYYTMSYSTTSKSQVTINVYYERSED